MQKIWYAMWEVMFACVKNDAPEAVVLSLVEQNVNTTTDAVEELKRKRKLLMKLVEEKAKRTVLILRKDGTHEYRLEKQVNQK